tara:strand:+ start:5441 stop:5584 length:144 start_codon:yes stop_codon:yes gene_type:complete
MDLRQLGHQIFDVVVAHSLVWILKIGDDPFDHAGRNAPDVISQGYFH